MFLTWITITAEISSNFGITNMAKGGHIGGHIDDYIEFVVPYRLISFSCIHNIAKLS